MQRWASSGQTGESTLIDSRRLRAITGIITLSSAGSEYANGRVVADDLCADHEGIPQESVDLARHDAGAGLQVGKVDSPPDPWSVRRHPSQVVADLDQADGDGAQLARKAPRANP